MEIATALGAGLLAGLALAVPLGAIGVLLIHEGASRGWAQSLPAAGAVATVDVLYCMTAMGAGAALVPVTATWDPWPRVIGGAALVGLAVWNLVRMRRSATGAATGIDRARARPGRRFVLFFALTAGNPATLVYFAAIATGLSATSVSLAAATVFVAGVGLASLCWQLLLALAGALLRWKTGSRFRYCTTLIGNGAVGMLGVVMIAGVVA